MNAIRNNVGGKQLPMRRIIRVKRTCRSRVPRIVCRPEGLALRSVVKSKPKRCRCGIYAGKLPAEANRTATVCLRRKGDFIRYAVSRHADTCVVRGGVVIPNSPRSAVVLKHKVVNIQRLRQIVGAKIPIGPHLHCPASRRRQVGHYGVGRIGCVRAIPSVENAAEADKRRHFKLLAVCHYVRNGRSRICFAGSTVPVEDDAVGNWLPLRGKCDAAACRRRQVGHDGAADIIGSAAIPSV